MLVAATQARSPDALATRLCGRWAQRARHVTNRRSTRCGRVWAHRQRREPALEQRGTAFEHGRARLAPRASAVTAPHLSLATVRLQSTCASVERHDRLATGVRELVLGRGPARTRTYGSARIFGFESEDRWRSGDRRSRHARARIAERHVAIRTDIPGTIVCAVVCRFCVTIDGKDPPERWQNGAPTDGASICGALSLMVNSTCNTQVQVRSKEEL